MTLTFFNVGYGEAVLVECPDPARPSGRFVMLLDGGSGEAKEFPSELPQRAPLIRELERRGLDQIDVVVSTHIHEDHVCGLLPVLERFTPGELWQALDGALALQLPQLPQVELEHPSRRKFARSLEDWRKLTLQAQRRGVKLRQLTAGDCASPCPGLTARALSPRWGQAEDLAQAVRELFYTQEPERFRERLTALDGAMNNYSLVLSLEHQGARALLPGDANAAACGQIDPELLSADLFKVGHHGQRDGASRELIAAIRPKVVVCCASSDRRYQSADPELLQMIAASGARLCFSDCPPVPREIPAPPPHRAVQIVLTGGRAPEITYFTKEGDVCHGGI